MIHIFVGTKAQVIKMAPIMLELDRRGIPYNFIDAGQHGGMSGDLIKQFGLRDPDVRLRQNGTSIATVPQALAWTARALGRLAVAPGQVRRQVFQARDGICLIHGDTLTTLLSLIYARRCGLAVAHVEAGLRSHNLLDPFPEEVIRLIAMRFSHRLFAPSPAAYGNLVRMGVGDRALDVGGNTVQDAVAFVRHHAGPAVATDPRPYAVATCHRVETIYQPARLEQVVALMERIASERPLYFVMHEPTRRQLEKRGLYTRLADHPGVTLLPLQPYLDFLALVAGARFVVTDGGSIQEESYALGVPCLILRHRTERGEGLGENAVLSRFDGAIIDRFLATHETLRRPSRLGGASPSARIVDEIQEWA